MESYILRIYRRDARRPDHVFGVVEDVQSDERLSFSSLSELTSILCERSRPLPGPRERVKSG